MKSSVEVAVENAGRSGRSGNRSRSQPPTMFRNTCLRTLPPLQHKGTEGCQDRRCTQQLRHSTDCCKRVVTELRRWLQLLSQTAVPSSSHGRKQLLLLTIFFKSSKARTVSHQSAISQPHSQPHSQPQAKYWSWLMKSEKGDANRTAIWQFRFLKIIICFFKSRSQSVPTASLENAF